MTTITLGDILDRALDFERRLEGLYADLRDRATRDGPKLLVYYLARHRRHLPEALGSFTSREIEHVRAAPLKYDDTDFEPARIFLRTYLSSDITGEQLLDAAILLVKELIQFYGWVAQQPLGPEASQLVEGLLHIEERHIVELKKIKAMDYF